MKLAEGMELMNKIKEINHYTEKEAQGIFKQVLEGIQYLHSQGVCHRDIKPQNIMVSEKLGVVVTDYNVAFKRNEDNPEECKKDAEFNYDGVIVMHE
jgi:serine/threonine protein kinase